MTCYELIDTYFKVGVHDSVCGLPKDDKLGTNGEYLRGWEHGTRLCDELEQQADEGYEEPEPLDA